MAHRQRRISRISLVLLVISSTAALGPLAAVAPAMPPADRSTTTSSADSPWTSVNPTSEAVLSPADERGQPREGDLDRSSVPESSATVDCPIDRLDDADRESDPEVTTPDEARIVELYPNPTTYENVGEYLVLETPSDTSLENWTITDGHTTAGFPNETVSGRVAASTDPDATDPFTDYPIVELDGSLRLAVDGDELTLRNDSEPIDVVSYDRAPLAERWYRGGTATEEPDGPATHEQHAERPREQWWPRGATCRPVSNVDTDEAMAFVLPDGPDVPLETIREADDRLLLAGYTLTDPDVTDELVDAANRGVDVSVLLESGPVGGAPEETRDVIETLEAADVSVRAIGGEGARYQFHHPKYAVADETVVVTTENWKPAGVGGASSRGWGVKLADPALAADLAAVFRADFEGRDTKPGASYLESGSFVDDDVPRREFEASHEPATVPVESAELLLAPDNAEYRLNELIASATDELLIKQASVDPDVSVLDASIAAAERGVSVRLLLDASWYVEDDHERLAADLDRIAASDDLDVKVRLVDDTDSFEKIHAKGIVVDRETAVVGSANWNDNAFRNNREVLLALHGPAVANYYATVFEDDWAGESWSLPIGLSSTVVAALVGAAIVGRRYVRFGNDEVAARTASD